MILQAYGNNNDKIPGPFFPRAALSLTAADAYSKNKYMTIKKVIFLLCLGLFLFRVPEGRGARLEESASGLAYSDYRAIPGVTEEEIADIEALRARRGHFVYGMTLGSETFHDENGNIGGYSKLFCDWLSSLFDLNFKPEIYEWGALLNGMGDGSVDFSGELTDTPERREQYFMTEPIAERAVKRMRIAGSESLTSLARARVLRFGFLRGAITHDMVMPLEKRRVKAFLLDDYTTAYQLLAQGRIDAFFDESSAEAAFDAYGDVTTELFFPLTYSQVSLSTRNPELQAVISVVQKALRNGAGQYLARAYNKGYQDYMRHKFLARLNEEELAYLRRHLLSGRVVPLAAEYDNYPASFYNAHEDAWQGIAYDVLDEISSFTGLKFARAHQKRLEWPELLRMLESGEAVMITELLRSEEREGRFLWADSSYQKDYYTLLSKAEYPDININEILYSRVGLIADSAYAEKFRTWFPGHAQSVEYPSTAEALKALENGQVDLVMATRSLLLSLTNFFEQPGFKSNLVFKYPFESTYGFNINERVLASIISKALGMVDTEDISERWTRKLFDYSLKITQAQRPWLVGSLFLGLCVFALIFIIILRGRRDKAGMESIVRERTTQLRAVINNYSGVIWSVDQDKIITTFNGLYLKTIGVTPDFLEGKSLYLARGKNRHLDIIDKIEETMDSAVSQDWVGDIDGRMFHSHTTPIINEEGLVVGVVGSTDDITDSMLLQKKLEDAVVAAEAASRAKSEFLSNMSHEMRTPMNAIIGMTSIGKTASDLDKKDYAFGKIESASAHLLGVINDILDMSKIEAGKFEISTVEFNLEKMLQKVVNVVSFRVDEKKQSLTVHIGKDIPPFLLGDDQRLTQVITNLLSNAVKFTPEGGAIRLDARLDKDDQGQPLLRIEVSDTGIGISEEQQALLFKAFQQAESNTTRKFGGTGLGLVISKRIVELMGGNIWIKSAPGQGSTFTFTVKAEQGSGVQDGVGLLPPGVNWSSLRALAVDDSPEILEHFSDIAEQLGFSCAVAESGAAALKKINEEGPYDLYFVDWKMPGMDGMELASRIKSGSGSGSVVIMISAADWNALSDAAKKSGVDKFLAKPLFPSSIADCINECLGRDNVAEQAEEAALEESFAGHRILLAEDVDINREIVLALLEPSHLEIDCAENGAAALRMFSAAPERYDMIFMDLQMPEMDGYEATRRIRALDDPKARQVPIIAMTANVFREDVEKCLAAGMNDHVGKPLDLEVVLGKLRKYLPAL